MAGECRRPAKAKYLAKDPTTFPLARRHGRESQRYYLVPLRVPCALTHQRPYASGERAGWRGRVCKTPSLPSPTCGGGLGSGLAAAGDLGPGVAQAHGAVEHRALGRGVLVAGEIAEPLELHGIVRIAPGQGRLDAGVG